MLWSEKCYHLLSRNQSWLGLQLNRHVHLSILLSYQPGFFLSFLQVGNKRSRPQRSMCSKERTRLCKRIWHFNQLVVHLEDNMPEICIAAFEHGLRASHLNSDLSRQPRWSCGVGFKSLSRKNKAIWSRKTAQTRRFRDSLNSWIQRSGQ